MARTAAFKFALTSSLLVFLLSIPGLVPAKGPREGSVGNPAPTVAVVDLPPQGKETLHRIRAGGPFAADKDGSVFGNRERLLPARSRGYYREYTVKTPGSRDRGARRIVCGGQPRAPDACYYTSDHYASFRRIVE